MKRLLLLTLLLGVTTACMARPYDSAALPSPRSQNTWVHDGAGVVADRTGDIDKILDALERDTGAEVTVATVPSIGDEVPKDFATALFNAWGVGKKGKDNGVLVLHVIDQRRVEIETGYGVEAILTDARCKRIIDEVTIPYFKAESFADGHYETVRAIDRGLRNRGKLGALAAQFERAPGVHKTAVPEASAMTAVPQTSGVEFPAGSAFFALCIFAWMGLIVLLALVFDPHFAGKVYYWLGWGEYVAAFFVAFGLGRAVGTLPLVTLAIGALGVFGAFFWRKRFKGWLRRRPRKCGECKSKILRPLDDEAEDEHLEKGQVVEESVGAADYDVWYCGGCGWHRVDSHRVHSSYSRCSSCNYKTRSTASETIVSPTYSSSGRAKLTTSCSNCGKSSTSYTTLAQLQHTTSSSGSSSSGGGSSFGGGSSGGGGAGGSY
jgi:uncharacterized protein